MASFFKNKEFWMIFGLVCVIPLTIRLIVFLTNFTKLYWANILLWLNTVNWVLVMDFVLVLIAITGIILFLSAIVKPRKYEIAKFASYKK